MRNKEDWKKVVTSRPIRKMKYSTEALTFQILLSFQIKMKGILSSLNFNMTLLKHWILRSSSNIHEHNTEKAEYYSISFPNSFKNIFQEGHFHG